MALVKGTNSYVTVAEADAYFETRIDSDIWFDASNSEKIQALVTSTAVLDQMSWAGVAVSAEQSLAFPRNGSYFDPRAGQVVMIDGVPSRIVQACYEQALHLLSNEGLYSSTGSVTSLQVGRIQLDTIISPESIAPVSNRLVKPLLVNSGANMWYRAN